MDGDMTRQVLIDNPVQPGKRDWVQKSLHLVANVLRALLAIEALDADSTIAKKADCRSCEGWRQCRGERKRSQCSHRLGRKR